MSLVLEVGLPVDLTAILQARNDKQRHADLTTSDTKRPLSWKGRLEDSSGHVPDVPAPIKIAKVWSVDWRLCHLAHKPNSGLRFWGPILGPWVVLVAVATAVPDPIS